MNRRYLAAFFACIGSAGAADCGSGLEPFLSCEVGVSKKNLNVCYNDDIVTYSFGPAGDPELVMTETVETIDYRPWSGIGRSIAEQVIFENGEYVYAVYAGVDRMFGDETEADHPTPFFGGVVVTRNGNALADLSCNREETEAPWGGLYESKLAAGLEWDSVAMEWRRAE